jgi:hypothetical protein
MDIAPPDENPETDTALGSTFLMLPEMITVLLHVTLLNASI